MVISKSPKLHLLVLLVLVGLSAPALAVTKTWNGSSNDWHLAGNWMPTGVPAPGDDVVFDGTSQQACYLTAPAEIMSLTMSPTFTGAFQFQSYALIISGGTADFRSGGSISAGTGRIVFTGGGNQIFHPKAGTPHPRVIHDGSGTLRLASNTLTTLGFLQVAGVLDLTGASITTLSSGEFVIQNGGPSTLIGLAGRTLQVGGITLLMGTAEGNLNLDPGAAWTLASAGPVHVDYADLSDCNASVTAGVAYRSTDAGNNSNWSFPGATTFHWHRNLFATGAFNRSHNWTSGPDGSGFRPPGIGDDPFTSDALGGAWTFFDADADAATGSYSLLERPDQLKLLGGGRGADPTYNEFVAVHREDLAGNFDVTVRLVFQSPDAPLAEAGLLVADDPANPALGGYCVLGRSPDGTLHFRRDMDGNGTLEADITAGGLHGPLWLRLVKDGNVFSAFYRQTPAGGSWQQLGTGYSFASVATASVIGLYSTSGETARTAEAVFDDFQAGGDMDGAFDLRFDGTGTNADADAYLMANTAAASVDFTGYAGILNFSGNVLDVQQGDAVFSSTMTLSGGSGTLRFSAAGGTQTLVPKAGSSLPDIQKTGGGTVVVSTHPLLAMGFTLAGGTWDWGSSGATHSLNSMAATGGSLSFGSSTVQVYGNADLSGLSSLSAGSGTLVFNGASAQTFTPHAGSTHPTLQINGTGTVTVAANALNANAVDLVTGGLDLATHALGLSTAGNVSLSGGTLSLSTAAIGGDLTMTGGALSAPANAGNFSVAGSVSITAGTYAANSGTLTLNGTSAGLALNLSGATLYGLTLNGTGATWTAASNISAPGSFTLTAGTLDISTNLITLSTGAFQQTGGTLNASGGTVDVNAGFTQTGGTFNAPGSARMFSVANSFVQTGGTFMPGDGELTFDGTGAGNSINTATALNAIEFTGSGAWTVTTNNLSVGSLSLAAATLNLGAGLTHDITGSTAFAGGGLEWGSSTLRIHGSALNLNGVAFTNPGTGTLEFVGAGNKTFIPRNGDDHPRILLSGAGAVTVSGYDLWADEVELPAGALDIGAQALTTNGDLTVTGGHLDVSAASQVVIGGDVVLTAGTIDCPPSTFQVAGSVSTAVAGTWNPNGGSLVLGGNAAGQILDLNHALHDLSISGSGGEWTVSSQGLNLSGNLQLISGTLNLGTSLVHAVGAVSSTGGALDFNSSTLQVTSGNANLSGLGTLAAGTGTLAFTASSGYQTLTPLASTTHPHIVHSGAGELEISGYGLTCLSFTQTAGTLDLTTQDITTVSGGDFTLTGGSPATMLGLAGRTLTVAGNATLDGISPASRLNLDPVAAWNLTVAGTLTASHASLGNNTAGNANGACADCVNSGGNTGWTYSVTWDGGGADENWSTAGNWGSDAVPTASDNVQFNGTSVRNAVVDAAAAVNSITFTAAYTGIFSFGSGTLTVSGPTADFRSGGAINAGSGALRFSGVSAQTFIPKAGATFPAIELNGTGTATITTHAVNGGNLSISGGTLNLGTGLTHAFAAVGGTAGGTLDFGGSSMDATGDVDFSSLIVLATGSNTLAFTGGSAQTYTPTADPDLRLAQNGVGGTTVLSLDFSTPSLTVSAGTFNLGTGRSHAVTTALSLTGGGLDFGSSSLAIHAATVDLSNLDVLTPGTGTLQMAGSSAQTLVPRPGSAHPLVLQIGSGTTTLATHNLAADALSIAAGGFNLGTGLTHAVGSITASGGTLDFGSSALQVTTGNADLAGLAGITAGTGTLSFTAANGTQTFTPRSGAVHPPVLHIAGGTLRLSTHPLSALGFTQSAGILDLNGVDLTLAGSGNLQVTGSPVPFIGLGGRTLSVPGDARFAGSAGNRMALDPATAWTLAVSGSLTAANVSLRNSAATLGAGIADSSSDLGGNTGWTFLDTVKPDNVDGFVATATGGHAVALAWSAPAAEDADSVMLRYRTDGTYPTGPADGVLWRKVDASRTADTATGLADKSVHHFAAFVQDSSGNHSLADSGSRDTARTPDVTPPAPVTAMTADGVDSTRAALAWTASASADADSVMIRYRPGLVHPTGTGDGTHWKTLPVSATADTVTGLAPNTFYAFGLFVRDSSGNYSAAVPGTQDTSLYQRPVVGVFAIGDVSGLTRDADPPLHFTGSGADSLRFSLAADTGAAVWIALRASDSLPLGTDGAKVLGVQYKNVFGRRSAWYLDTTLLDRTAPVVTLGLEAQHSRWNWPASLAGLSRDLHSGTDRVSVTRQRLSDGAWFNGSAWVQSPDTARLVLTGKDSLFSVAMPASALATGNYRFSARALDRAGNLSDAVSMDVAYQDNQAPALASADIPDTLDQNREVSWLLDFGDLDAGDSLSVVSLDLPGWLTASPGPDTAWGPWAVHKTFRLAGKPLQAHVGNVSLQARLQDRGGLILTWSKALHVRDVNDPPAFDDGQAAFAAREDSLTYWRPKFKDADPADRHTMSMLQGPAFAKVDSISVALAPGSRDVGDHPVRLVVSDGFLSDTLETVLTVVDVNDPPYAFPSAGWMSPAFWREDKVDTFTVVVVDMDRNDEVNLATALPSYITVSRATDATGYNHAFRFTVKPTGKDTGAVNAALVFRDAAGATSQLNLMGRIQADNDAPTASIEEGRTHAGAARFRLSVADEDGTLEETRFHYRLIGPSGDTLRRGIVPTANLAIHPLADGAYRLAVKAEDKDGLRQEGFTVADFNVSGATILPLDSGRWHMVGAPHASLVATALGTGATLAGWDEAGDEGQPLARYATGQAVDSLRRGKGYWVRLKANATLKAASEDLLEASFPLRLTRVKQGWNQIANPFPYWVDLSSTRLTFWEWDADRRDLVNAKGLLKPWAAYWVLAHRDTTVVVPDAPWFPAAGAPVAKRAVDAGGGPSGAPGLPGLAGASRRDDDDAAYRGREDWTLRLALSAGAYHDAANLMGVRGASISPASDRGDERAIPDAPKFGEYVALHFERMPASVSARPAAVSATAAKAATSASTQGPMADVPDLGFATDLRAALDPEEEWWDFSVENSGTGESRARLAPHGLEALASAGLRLYLVRLGEALAVEPGGSVALDMEGELTHYSLVITPHADFAERLKGNFSISQNFPNPVTTFTSFRFFLPQSWDKEGRRVARDFKVRINLYDYSGRLVATAADGIFRPGSHTLRWRPATRSASPLAKGPYVYRLETAGFTKSLKLIVE